MRAKAQKGRKRGCLAESHRPGARYKFLEKRIVHLQLVLTLCLF